MSPTEVIIVYVNLTGNVEINILTQFLLKADGSNMAPETSSVCLAAPFPAASVDAVSLKVPFLRSTDASLVPGAYDSGIGKVPPALDLVDTICLPLHSGQGQSCNPSL